MKKYFISLLCLGLILYQTGHVIGQIVGGSTPTVMQTINAKVSSEKADKDMYQLAMYELFSGITASEKRHGGIIADNFGTGGRVTLSVYLYDRTSIDGKGKLIYKCYSDQASTDFLEKAETISSKDALSDASVSVSSTDIVQLLSTNNIYKQTCTQTVSRYTTSSKVAITSGVIGAGCIGACVVGVGLSWFTFGASLAPCAACVLTTSAVTTGAAIASNGSFTTLTQEDYDCAKNYSAIQPIIVEVSVKNATLRSIKVPVLGSKNVNDIFNCVNTFNVTVNINGVAQTTINYPSSTIPTYNVTMGDSVSITVNSDKNVTPEIHGVTRVWPATFAGDMMFQCNPDVQPGEYNPFIGLDSRVHTLMLRKYPAGFQTRVPDWNPKGTLSNGIYTYSWGWTADRQMDPAKSKYTPSLTWPKCHLSPVRNADGSYDLSTCKNMGTTASPVYQRQDQKEGLNIQYLSYFRNWPISLFQGYDGPTKYMKGFDDDELAYFNTKYPKVSTYTDLYQPCNTPDCQNTGGITKLEVLPWKSMIEGMTQMTDPLTGYPNAEGGYSLNWMIDAYRRSKTNLYSRYSGYEIQDTLTDWNHPDGAGKNNANPGLVTVKTGTCGQSIQFKLNVVSPLDNEGGRALGFYEALIGESNPSTAEPGVRYWLRGVKNKSDTEIAKYTLVYSWMDRLGNVSEKTANVLNDIVTPWRSTGSIWPTWVNTKETSSASNLWGFLDSGTGKGFDMERPAYSWITAYYQKTSTSRKVPVAGKELTSIFLMFCGVDSLSGNKFVEGQGQASRVFLEDYRQNSAGDFTESKKFGNTTKYTKKYTRDYVLQQGSSATFTTMDGDPYSFDNNEEEWYLSNRSMAKRVRDYLLDGSYSIDPNTGKKVQGGQPDASKAYLQYYIKPLNADGTDGGGSYTLMTSTQTIAGISTIKRKNKNLTCTFTTPGYYALKVAYRNGSDLYHRIRVVNYSTTSAVKGQIAAARNLTDKEAGWLGISSANKFGYWIYEVKNILTQYQYQDGYRAKVSDNSVYNSKPNRWSKFNDYADQYQWQYQGAGDSGPTTFSSVSNVTTYLNNYDQNIRRQWFWKDWALHYSSNWLSIRNAQGQQGLPPYVPESYVTRINKPSDLNSYNNYIQNTLFNTSTYANQLKAPWQFVIPLLSYTDYYGIRGRTNPSCIYDLAKVFNTSNGAFSGNAPNPANPEDIQAPDYSDDYKDQQDFYNDLLYGRKVIVGDLTYRNTLSGKTISVYQSDPKTSNKTFVANMSSSARQAAEEAPELVMEVAPNPSYNGALTVFLSKKVSGEVHFELLDLLGRKALVHTDIADSADQFTIKTKDLATGMYIIKATINNSHFTKKVVINN